MSVICQTSCGEITVPAEYHECESNKIEHGYSYFALIDCNYQFIDILDPDEWETARGAGSIIVSPPGILDIPVPTQESIVATGCGQKLTGNKTYVINYTTYWRHPDLDDFEFFDAIDRGYAGYRLIWWDCRGAFFMEPDWVAAVKAWEAGALTIAGSNPGFEFSVTQTPWPIEGEGKLSQWSMVVEIETINMIKAAFLDGVKAVLESPLVAA